MGVGSIVFNWLSRIHEYHKLRERTKDRSADILLLLLPFINLFQSYVKASDFLDLYADGSLSRCCEAAIPRLYTDMEMSCICDVLASWLTPRDISGLISHP
jgi:prepilin signal peptidase PulO-like enzyme (type II secretory pathway)